MRTARSWLDGMGVQGVLGQLICFLYYSIDIDAGEVNVIMVCAIDVCLLDD